MENDAKIYKSFLKQMTSNSPTSITNVRKNILEHLKNNMKHGVLASSNFELLWKVCIPSCYSLAVNEKEMYWNVDERLTQDLILQTMDDFICNGNSISIFKELSNMDKASSVRVLL